MTTYNTFRYLSYAVRQYRSAFDLDLPECRKLAARKLCGECKRKRIPIKEGEAVKILLAV